MPESNVVADGDLIKELRLRRWARLNYVPADERHESWSPIVLDEMRRKEWELREVEGNRVRASAYVPLIPGHHILHDGHAEMHRPAHVSQAPQHDAVTTRQWTLG